MPILLSCRVLTQKGRSERPALHPADRATSLLSPNPRSGTLFDLSLFNTLRCFFSSSRRSFAPLLTRVFFLTGTCLSASCISSTNRSTANSPFSTWLRVCWDMTRRTPSLADAGLKAAQNKFLLLWGKARRVHHVEPQGHTTAHLVNIIDYL